MMQTASHQKLSVIMITFNEALRLAPTLKALQWADEIIVVDSGSTDGTLEIARQLASHVVVADWPGFGAQKNRALALASHPWVLSIDADELVTVELQAEIKQFIASDDGTYHGATLRRLSSYCGKSIRHSGWWPDPVLRLFLRDKASFSNDRVHERVLLEGPVSHLKGILRHESFRNLDQVIHKLNHYSSEGALNLQSKGRQASLLTAIGHGCWAFFKTYIVKKGFLDGREGFILAVSNAEGTYYRYLKLMYLNQAESQP